MSHRLHSNTISAKNPTHFRVSTAGTALPFHLTATDKINLLARMRSKGRNTRERGWYHEKGKRKASLSLTGLREAKRPEDGTPCPFSCLDRHSALTDMACLIRQVFTFACHSRRTFLPVSVPLTT